MLEISDLRGWSGNNGTFLEYKWFTVGSCGRLGNNPVTSSDISVSWDGCVVFLILLARSELESTAKRER